MTIEKIAMKRDTASTPPAAVTDNVEFIEDGSKPTPDPEFIDMTPDDEAHIRQ